MTTLSNKRRRVALWTLATIALIALTLETALEGHSYQDEPNYVIACIVLAVSAAAVQIIYAVIKLRKTGR